MIGWTKVCLIACLIRYAAHEELPSGFDWVDYGRLEAFYAGEECGWGLRCTRAISDGTFVVEVRSPLMTADDR